MRTYEIKDVMQVKEDALSYASIRTLCLLVVQERQRQSWDPKLLPRSISLMTRISRPLIERRDL